MSRISSSGSPFMYGVRPESGYYVGPTGYRTTMAFTANVEYCAPMYFAAPGVITALGCEFTIAGTAGTVLRLGIRAGSGAFPGALLLDAGTIAGDGITAAGIEKTGLSFAVTPGLYWFTATAQVTGGTLPTIRGESLIDVWPCGSPTLVGAIGASSNTGYITAATVTGALPAAYVVSARSGLAPRIVAKFA